MVFTRKGYRYNIQDWINDATKITVDLPFHLYLLITCALKGLLCHLLWRKKQRQLNGEVILVTGAGSGVGRMVTWKIAQRFPQALFILWDWNQHGLLDTERQCRAVGVTNVHCYVVDLTKRQEIKAAAVQVLQDVGAVTVLISNTGLATHFPEESVDPCREEKLFQVHLLSSMWIIKEILPCMVQQGNGHLVLVCTDFASYRFIHTSPFVISKHGLKGFLNTLLKEIKGHPKKPYINISEVYPVWTKTLRTQGLTWESRYQWMVSVESTMKSEFVAEKIINGILEEQQQIIIPHIVKFAHRLYRYLPWEYAERLEKHLYRNLKTC